MQAIITKYHGPTNTRSSRVSATSAGGHRATLPWDHDKDVDGNHDAVALVLLHKLGWTGMWHRGGLKTGNVYVCSNTNKLYITIAEGV